MEFEKILKLVDAVAVSGLSMFELEENGVKVRMTGAGVSENRNSGFSGMGSSVNPELGTGTFFGNPSDTAQNGIGFQGGTVSANKTENRTDRTEIHTDRIEIHTDKIVKAPLVGTFYAAPSEDAEAFVKVGDSVKKGQVLGIIEAMKLMNEIETEYDGVIDAVLIENEQVVEYGQPLFRIR